MTLDELVAQHRAADTPRPVPDSPAVANVDLVMLAWWVVLLSKKPKPDGSPRFKFVSAAATKEEGMAALGERQRVEAERIADVRETGSDEEPFQYFLIQRPAIPDGKQSPLEAL